MAQHVHDEIVRRAAASIVDAEPAEMLSKLEQLRAELAAVDDQLRDELRAELAAVGGQLRFQLKLLRGLTAMICSVLVTRVPRRHRLLFWHLGIVICMSGSESRVEAFSRLKSDSRMTCSRLEG